MRTACFLVAATLVFCVAAVGATWDLVFEDNFDGTAPTVNQSRWGFEIGYIRNNELQWYDNSSRNVNITDGMLRITATNETAKLPNGITPFCRSGSIFSKEAFTYGRFEMRARLPGRPGNGTWPAFWLLAADIGTIGWPMSGEIDIMENVGFTRNTLYTTLHDSQNSSERNNDISNHVQVPTMYTGFNVYSVEWRPHHIEFFVNNMSVLRYNNDNRCRFTSWPWNTPFQIKINLAIGGAWGGIHGVDQSIFPAEYEVDYVRVYQDPADVPPPCDMPPAYVAFQTTVETDLLRWSIAAVGDRLSALHAAMEADIAAIANVETSSVHTWAVIVQDVDGEGRLCFNVSLVNWKSAERLALFAAAMSTNVWATRTAAALNAALPSAVDLTVEYVGDESPFGPSSVGFRPRRFAAFDEPLRIPAWEYDFGGPSVAYHDTTPWNQNGAYGRAPPDYVDVGFGDGGNFAVGYIQPTEFLRYSDLGFTNQTMPNARAVLQVRARYASDFDGSSACEVDLLLPTGGELTTTLAFSNTGSWSTYTDSSWSEVRVPALELLASFALRLRFPNDPSPFNIESIELRVAMFP